MVTHRHFHQISHFQAADNSDHMSNKRRYNSYSLNTSVSSLGLVSKTEELKVTDGALKEINHQINLSVEAANLGDDPIVSLICESG